MTLFNSLMGPLGKEYCVIFYGIGILIFLLMLVSIFGGLFAIVTNKEKNIKLIAVATIVNGLTLFLIYLLYRIVYNI